MGQDIAGTLKLESSCRDPLHELVRKGAREMIARALEAEVAEYLERFAEVRDPDGHRLVVRNGYKPERTVLTGIGPVPVVQPRVDDRRIDEHGQRQRFSSLILPPYLRRAQSVEELIPWLYLKGISSGDLSEALAKDREELLAFYDFPAEHWSHLRTTNPIESPFAGVRLRTDKTKGSGSRSACLMMVFKLVENAQEDWRALNGSALLPEIIRGVRFVDGVRAAAA